MATLERAARRRKTLAAALLVAASLTLWDVWIILARAPNWSPTWSAWFGFAGVSWGIGASLALTFGLIRTELVQWLSAGQAGRAATGALDALAVWLFIVFGHSPASLQKTWLRVAVLILVLLLGAFAASRLNPRRSRLAGLAWLVLSVAGLVLTSPNSDVFPRLMLSGIAVIAIAHLLPATDIRIPLYLAVLGACGFAGIANPLLSHSEGAKKLLSHFSVHSRTWTLALESPFDRDGDGVTNLFGAQDCDPDKADVFPGATELGPRSLDRNCSRSTRPAAGMERARSSSWGLAKGRDILILSIDSLRFDLASELPETRALLGPHAWLSRAASPTAATVTALSSVLRGRLFRQVRFDRVSGLRGSNPVFDPSPTIGNVLRENGYQTLTVPTHRYLESDTRVLAGFDSSKPETTGRFVRASVIEKHILPELSASSKPVCLFVHYMESHHPYRYGSNVGPDNLEGLRRAIRFVDQKMASLISKATEQRGVAPIVVIFGDHGDEFGEHGGRVHGTTAYAEQVLVPLFIAGPGVPSGDFSAPVSTAAVPATLLDLLGIEVPTSLTVRSLLPYLTGESAAPQLTVSEVRSLRTMNGYTFERHRLIRDPKTGASMLFDSRRDPLESEDLASEHPELLRTLIHQSQRWDDLH